MNWLFQRTNTYYRILLFVFIIACSSTSCNHHHKNPKYNGCYDEKCDSIIYELPEKATKTLLEMLSDKKVSFCIVARSSLVNYGYTFSFSYDDKSLYSSADSVLLSKTNTYLKLETRYYPVIKETDYIFSQLPEDREEIINDFNYCFITVDVKGNMIDGHAY